MNQATDSQVGGVKELAEGVREPEEGVGELEEGVRELEEGAGEGTLTEEGVWRSGESDQATDSRMPKIKVPSLLNRSGRNFLLLKILQALTLQEFLV